MRRCLPLLLALLAGAAAFSGCGKNNQNYKYRIVVIPKGLTHEFWQSIHRGADRASVDLDKDGIKVRIFWDGPLKESDAKDQIDIIRKHVATGIDGLVLAPQHSKTMVDPVRQVIDNNIPVVIIDSGLDDASLYVKYVATDNYQGGRKAAEHLIKTLKAANKPAARIALFRYQKGSESTEQREQGFLDVLNEEIKKQKQETPDGPSFTLVSDDQYAGATVDTAQRAADPWLTRMKGKVDAIFAPNESSATGVLNALRAQSLNQANEDEPARIRLMAFDSSKPLRDALKKGDIEGTIVQDPYRMGYMGVWFLVRHLEGNDVGSGDKNFSTGEYLVTRENVDADATLGLFDEDYQAKRTIDTPALKKK